MSFNLKSKARYLGAFTVSNLLLLLGFVKRAKIKILSSRCILSVYFHNPSKKEFESCVKWLKANKFKFIDINELEKIIAGELPFPFGSVILTVDDGWKNNEENIVEIANKYSVPITIFVSTEPVEDGSYWWSYIEKAKKNNFKSASIEVLKSVPNEVRVSIVEDLKSKIVLEREAMTIEQVERISRSPNITIGSHSHSHPILPQCKANEVFQELSLSQKKLESWTSKRVSYFAYPNGDYTVKEKEILKGLNYKLAFTTSPELITPTLLTNRYELPRFALWENAPFAENKCRMVGIWAPLMSKIGRLALGFRHKI